MGVSLDTKLYKIHSWRITVDEDRSLNVQKQMFDVLMCMDADDAAPFVQMRDPNIQDFSPLGPKVKMVGVLPAGITHKDKKSLFSNGHSISYKDEEGKEQNGRIFTVFKNALSSGANTCFSNSWEVFDSSDATADKRCDGIKYGAPLSKDFKLCLRLHNADEIAPQGSNSRTSDFVLSLDMEPFPLSPLALVFCLNTRLC